MDIARTSSSARTQLSDGNDGNRLNPVLIGGTGRCGTWLVMDLLYLVGNVFYFGEPDGLHEFFIDRFLKTDIANRTQVPLLRFFESLRRPSIPPKDRYSAFRALYVTTMETSLRRSVELWRPRNIPADIDAYFDKAQIDKKFDLFSSCRTVEEHKERFCAFVDSLLGEFARQCGSERWCIKQPGYLYARIDEIGELYPNMRFIHMVRDGRDVVASTMQQPWARGKTRDERFDFAVNHWSRTLEEGWVREKRIPAHTVMTVRLEDLLDSPDEVMERMLQFLNVSERRSKAATLVTASKGHVGRFRQDLAKDEVRFVEDHFGHILERYNYPL